MEEISVTLDSITIEASNNMADNSSVAVSKDKSDLPHLNQDPRNHIEISLRNNFAGVSDKGLIHHDNQDSLGLSVIEILVSPIDVPPIYVMVVCDGVSSSEAGASASEMAMRTINGTLENAFSRNPDINIATILTDAICSANQAVCSMSHTSNAEADPSATTVVVAVIRDNIATIGWIGDSRAYWVTSDDAGVLTRDDSWINAMMDAGQMTEEEALVSPYQHALYKCLGGEISDDEKGKPLLPSFAIHHMTPGTRLILCSDGFWNYAVSPEEVAKVVRQTPPHDALKTAKHLVNFAIVGGGHDNITVSVLSV